MRSIKKEGIQEKAEESKVKKLDDAGQLELSEKGQSMTKLEGKQAKNELLQNKNQIAIIGFWQKDKQSGEFHCYHFFYV